MFSVLFGFWLANYIAFDGNAMRELAAQFLTLAEKQRTTSRSLSDIALWAPLCSAPGTLRKASTPRSGNRDLRSCRASPAGDAIWPWTQLGQSFLSIMGALDAWLCRAAAIADAEQAVVNAREIGQAITLMHALGHAAFTIFPLRPL